MATSKKKAPDKDASLLAKHAHHHAMADKHRAHADLIEAKLRVQGKRIDKYGDYPSAAPNKVKPKVVKVNH